MSDNKGIQRDNFTFIWKIENFSLLFKLLNEKFIESPEFNAENLYKTCWQLRLTPPGYLGENKDTFHVKLFKVSRRISFTMYFGYELSILSNDDTKVKSVVVSRFEIDNLNSKEKSLYITPHEILSKREILSGDTLTIQCKIWFCDKECLKPGFSLAHTRIGAERKSFSWIVDKFSTLQIDDQKSVSVELRKDLKLSFEIILYLTGIPTYKEKIRLKVVGNNEGAFDFVALLKISLLNINGGVVVHSEDKFKLLKGKEEWRFPLILEKKQLVSNKELFLRNDEMSLKCLLIVSKGDIVLNEIEHTVYGPDASLDLKAALTKTIEPPCVEKEVHPSSNSLTNDMRHLLEDKKRADVIFRVQNEIFPVHKTILAARSTVFETMFDTDMKEKITNSVEIDDFDPDTIRRLLLYIYSDTFEDIQWKNASNLYLAAEKYAVLGLKEECSSFLKKNFTTSNVCDILVLADILKDEKLKNCALSFIQDNDIVIMNSLEWEQFVQRHSQLAAEILTLLYKNVKSGCY